MKLERLRLRGFIGIKRGLGQEDLELELGALHGLIAISGQNGAGKTTLLDNLHPFRQLASRDGSLQNHVYLRDSIKELEFSYDGSYYRTVIKIDANTGRSEGYVHKDGESMVDGKVKNYDRYIKSLLGSPRLFFNSVFCAQNSEKLSDLTTGNLKALFSEFLRLDRYVAWEDTAKQVVNLHTAQIGEKYKEAHRLQPKDGMFDKVSKNKLDAELKVTQIKDDTRTVYTKIEALRIDHDTYSKEVAEHNLAKNRSAALHGEVARLLKVKDELLYNSNAINQAKRAKILEINSRLKELYDILSHADEIESAKVSLDYAKGRLGSMQTSLGLLNAELETGHKVARGLSIRSVELAEEIAMYKGDESVKKAEVSLIAAQKRRADLKNADIHETRWVVEMNADIKNMEALRLSLDLKDPACTSSTCGLIVDALKADEKLTALKDELADGIQKMSKELEIDVTLAENQCNAEADYLHRITQQINKKLEAAKAEADGVREKQKGIDASLAAIEAQIKDVKASITLTEADIKSMEQNAKRAEDLAVAVAESDGLEKQRADIEAEIISAGETVQKGLDDLKAQLATTESEITLIKTYPEAQKLLDVVDDRIASYEKELNRLQEDLTTALGEIAVADTHLNMIAKSLEEIDLLEADIDRLNEERDQWSYIKDACGKDGIRALEIDAVSPLMSKYANDLLYKTFGPSHTVRFETQDPETGREVLNIYVIREDGSETLLERLSGGERVWVLKSLHLAMTLISTEKSGRSFDTIMADEEDGALSRENAIAFVNLYRELMSLGGMKCCFFISHRPEAVSMADYQLKFMEGRIAVI